MDLGMPAVALALFQSSEGPVPWRLAQSWQHPQRERAVQEGGPFLWGVEGLVGTRPTSPSSVGRETFIRNQLLTDTLTYKYVALPF